MRLVVSKDDWSDALAIRHEVFILEQEVPPELEKDGLDEGATHVVATRGDVVIGTARLVTKGEARIGRVAVLKPWRHRGIAGLLLEALETEARQLGVRSLTLHSQAYVQRLYEKHGYVPNGPGFEEAGIDHIPMAKRLP